MSQPIPAPVTGPVNAEFTKVKAWVAAAVAAVSQVLAILALFTLPDPWQHYVSIAVQVLSIVAGYVGVAQATNKPVIDGQQVDGAYQITTVPPAPQV